MANVHQEDDYAALHAALLAGEPTAPSRLAERLLPALAARFAGRERVASDPQQVVGLIDEVVFAYLQAPERYDPTRGLDLVGYLAMAVRGDLLNADRAANREQGRRADFNVELAVEGGNTEEEALNRLDPFDRPPEDLAAARAALADLDGTDRRLLQLMADGVRATGAYAAVLEIGHLPKEAQAREVKRHKDRLGKHLERWRARNR
jgi:hypothetical protein